MRVTIWHTTTYRFARPVGLNPHRLMLRPRSDLDLEVRDHGLDITPRAELAWSTDAFGNLVATATFAEPAAELRIASRLLVESGAPEWPVYPIAPYAQRFPFRYSDEDTAQLAPLLKSAAEDQRVAEWARRFVARPSTDTLALLKDLNAGVQAVIGYEPRSEENTRPAAETLRCGAGACRDLAELFLASARSLGFAARAVSGYLVDPARQGGADATHAWAEVYLPGPGWIAFDPTNARMGSAGLVKVAVGHASAQALPVVGSYVGEASDHLGLDVSVTTDVGAAPAAERADHQPELQDADPR